MLPTDKIVATRKRGVRLVSRILLAIQVLSLGHLLLVRHVTCPQHGDVIHLAHPIEASTAARDAGQPGSLRTVAASPVAIEGDHDHCLVCTETNRRFAILAPAAPVLLHVTVVTSAPPPGRDAVFAPIDLLLLSPKSSPPAA
jgi:hypothetical protein